MAIFTLGSLLCGLSTSAVELEAARVLQGIGGAALAPASLALLGTAFPDARQRTRAVATWAAISALGLGIGPTVGGVLVTDAAGGGSSSSTCRSACCAWPSGSRRWPSRANPAARPVDLPGQLASVLWMAALTYGFVGARELPVERAQVWVPLTVAALVLGLFLRGRAAFGRADAAAGAVQGRLFSATAAVTFLLGFVLISVPFFTVQFFQDVQHLSALRPGSGCWPSASCSPSCPRSQAG